MNTPLLPALPGYDDPQLIAHGTTALVFRAIQTRLNRAVAIKVITVDTESVPVNAQRELATTVALSSQPHIVSIIDTGVTDDDRTYIVMEYCEGGSYAQILRHGGPLPVDDVLEVGIKIGEALHAAHQVGIIHRDVKPSNILRGRFGPALTDFGIARAPDELGDTLTREMMTPHHASPEALLHQAQSAPSDVYSLASTMWTLLVGHPPFVDPKHPAMDMYAFRDRVLHERLPALDRDDVPAWLVGELTRAMSKLPTQRHATAIEFVERLRRGMLTQSNPSAPPDVRPPPPPVPDQARGQIHAPGMPSSAMPSSDLSSGPSPGTAASGGRSGGGRSGWSGEEPGESAPSPSTAPDQAPPRPFGQPPRSSTVYGRPTENPPVVIPPGTSPPPVFIPPQPTSPTSGPPSSGPPASPPGSSSAPAAPVSPAPLSPRAPAAPAPPAPSSGSPSSGSPWPSSPASPSLAPSAGPGGLPLSGPAPAPPVPAAPGNEGEGGWLDSSAGGPWHQDPAASAVVEGLGTRRFDETDLYPPSARRRGGFLAVLVAVAVLAIAGAAVLVLAQLGSPRPTAGPTVAPTPSSEFTKFISAQASGAPSSVRITEVRPTSVSLMWTDPSAGAASFIVVGTGPAQEKLESKTVKAGTTTVTFTGLSPTKNYCFVVAAVYAIDRVATAPEVCTSR